MTHQCTNYFHSLFFMLQSSSVFGVQVKDYLQKKFSELESPNKMVVSMGHGAKAWVSDFNHPHYMAGRKAMKTGTPANQETTSFVFHLWDLFMNLAVNSLSPSIYLFIFILIPIVSRFG